MAKKVAKKAETVVEEVPQEELEAKEEAQVVEEVCPHCGKNPCECEQAPEESEAEQEDDLLIITADHGNDPTWTGTDHTREKIPLLIYSKSIKNGGYYPERMSFADIGATILKNFNIEKPDYLLGTPIEELF